MFQITEPNNKQLYLAYNKQEALRALATERDHIYSSTLSIVRLLLLLPWLRQRQLNTADQSFDVELLTNTATEHVISNDTRLTRKVLPLLPCLMSLDLRHCDDGTTDAGIQLVAQHHPRLRKLYLLGSPVTQSSFNAFRHLEELDITWCKKINSVDFCARTLRVLYASWSSVDDAGLRNAVHLEVLHVRGCPGVTTVSPFAATLQELDASWGCNIGDAGLMHAKNLVSLDVTANSKVTTLQPFCHSLLDLTVDSGSGIDGSALSEATKLVKLMANVHHGAPTLPSAKIAFVPPPVRELIAVGRDSRISDASLQNATQLVKLDVSHNSRVTSLQPCAASLRSFFANGEGCKLCDAAVAEATHLVELKAKYNPNVCTDSWVRNSKGYLQREQR